MKAENTNFSRRVVITSVAVANACTAGAFEIFRPGELTYDGLWNARTSLWAGLPLVDNLIVVWWYASLTARAVEAAQQQAQVTRDQFSLAREEQEWKKRPCVVIDWKYIPPPQFGLPAGNIYVARNVGAGLALNVVLRSRENGISSSLSR